MTQIVDQPPPAPNGRPSVQSLDQPEPGEELARRGLTVARVDAAARRTMGGAS